jgi:hypothetical protein
MSEGLTPLERLDDAIREFVAAADEGQLQGWTLAWQSVRLANEEGVLPLVFGSDFTMGPSTSPEMAMGLAQLTRARLERQMVYGEPDDD